MATEQIHNGPVAVGQKINFSVSGTSLIVVSNQNLDSESYTMKVKALRRTPIGNDDDYVVMTPEILLDNDNNHQVLVTGDYSLEAFEAANIIAVVTS